MTFALFDGCKIPYYLKHYAKSTRAVLKALDIPYKELPFNCCGYPARALNHEAFIYSAAKNMALAESHGIDIVTPCKCCYGSLKHAAYYLREDESLYERTRERLQEDGLELQKTVKIVHLLPFLMHEVGVDQIAAKVAYPYQDLKIAAHYGCHALRPAQIVEFDNPVHPTLFEALIAVTGATSISWSRRLSCCGNPLWDKNNAMALSMMVTKLKDAHLNSADYICSACNYCQIQFDQIQMEQLHDQAKATSFSEMTGGESDIAPILPSILYPQLLGLSLGLSPDDLGLEENHINVMGITNHLK